MTNTVVGISSREKNYDPPKGETNSKYNVLIPQLDGPLTLKNISFEFPSHPSKGASSWIMHNLNAQEAQYHSFAEDLAQAPCAMSTLEVLQSYPTQWKALLKSIGGINTFDKTIISFDLE